MANLEVTTVTIGAPDTAALARFYERLLSWKAVVDDPGWAVVRNPAGGLSLGIQQEDAHVAPIWPGKPGDQQMQLHLEIRVDDLDGALAHALDCGATLAEFQPQDDVRVCVDPAGHPFCLWIET
jgi:catechol 2,3-dioxygenase-like lactoylglutathione lyase family enzyme